jgi:hypothetical protein
LRPRARVEGEPMNRITRTGLIAAMLALPLGGCGSMPDVNFDPTDWISGDIFGTKKPLPGERKALFPEGVPGVARGVPSDMVKGNQAAGSEGSEEASLVVEEPKPKPKPKAKPKPKVAAKPAPVAPTSTPTSVTVRRTDQPPPQAQQQQQPGAVQWPEPPSPQQQAPGGVQWPDPPPPR